MENLRVEDAMTTRPVTMGPDETVAAAAELMSERNISSLPVCVNRKLVGFVTSEDIIERVMSKGRSPSETKLREVMTESPLTTSPEMPLLEAIEDMANNAVKRLIVTDGDEVVGILTDGDAMRTAPGVIDSLYEEIAELIEDAGVTGAADMCESCGNYSEDLEVDQGELICRECRENI